VAVVTTFDLEDRKSEASRWARVPVGIKDITSKEKVVMAVACRNYDSRQLLEPNNGNGFNTK